MPVKWDEHGLARGHLLEETDRRGFPCSPLSVERLSAFGVVPFSPVALRELVLALVLVQSVVSPWWLPRALGAGLRVVSYLPALEEPNLRSKR